MSKSDIEEDFLEVDQPIPGQNFVCLSFISPEKIVKQKEIYLYTKFLEHVLTDEKKREFLFSLNPNDITYNKINDMIEDYKILHEKHDYNEFDELSEFKTSTRGVKVRGCYDTLKEAKLRAKSLQRKDPKFNVFVGQMGYWLPWDPASTDEIEAEYQEKQLNGLMKNYKINSEQRDMFYQEEKQKKIDEAIKENLKRKQDDKKPTEDAKQKIGELREILDEKDRAFNEVIKKSNVQGGSEKAAIVGNFESKHADPWMERKQQNNIDDVMHKVL